MFILPVEHTARLHADAITGELHTVRLPGSGHLFVCLEAAVVRQALDAWRPVDADLHGAIVRQTFVRMRRGLDLMRHGGMTPDLYDVFVGDCALWYAFMIMRGVGSQFRVQNPHHSIFAKKAH